MLNIYKLLTHFVVSLTLFIQCLPTLNANEKSENQLHSSSLQEVVLPTDLKDLTKQVGAIYYSSPSKNKVLIPVHFWGFMQKPGLHFLPAETSFIKALSMTGGPLPGAKLESVFLTRIENGTTHKYEFDLSDGGSEETQQFSVKNGDIVFVSQDKFYENRAYYTSLISIAISILSGILLFREVRKR